MWQQIFLIFVGLSSGIIIAGGVVGLMIGLSIVPRYAGITHTADHMLLYEDMTFLGIALRKSFVSVSAFPSTGDRFSYLIWYLFRIFLGEAGFWLLRKLPMSFPFSAGESVCTRGLPVIIIAIAAGKFAGCFLFYFLRWQ